MATTTTKTQAEVVAPAVKSEDTALATAAVKEMTTGMVEDLSGIAGLGMTTLDETTPPDPVEAARASVADELAKGGPAFGAFLKSIGLAVAETQAALDQTLVATSTALADAQIETVAVFTQELSDEGEIETATPVKTKLPLITFIRPASYQFTSVHLTADMEVSEFNTANGLNIKKEHSDFNVNATASYGLLGGFGASGGTAYNTRSDHDTEYKSSSERKAAGKLHMEATLEPRPDFALPVPQVVQKGPKIRLIVTERKEMKDATTPAADPSEVTERSVKVKATLVNKAGVAMNGKTLDVVCDNGQVAIEVPGATAGDGSVIITLKRTGLTEENRAAVAANLRVSMNLVNSSIPVSL